MSEILFDYERINPTSWAYLSSLLTIALFFKFNRVACLRNLDLLVVVLLAPGLLCIELTLRGEASEGLDRVGYVWLLVVNGVLSRECCSTRRWSDGPCSNRISRLAVLVSGGIAVAVPSGQRDPRQPRGNRSAGSAAS